MATDVKKIKFVYFVYVHPKAFHLTSYKQNLFFDLCQCSYIEKLPEITLNIQTTSFSVPIFRHAVALKLQTVIQPMYAFLQSCTHTIAKTEL